MKKKETSQAEVRACSKTQKKKKKYYDVPKELQKSSPEALYFFCFIEQRVTVRSSKV